MNGRAVRFAGVEISGSGESDNRWRNHNIPEPAPAKATPNQNTPATSAPVEGNNRPVVLAAADLDPVAGPDGVAAEGVVVSEPGSVVVVVVDVDVVVDVEVVVVGLVDVVVVVGAAPPIVSVA